MSDFNEFMADSLAEALDVLGELITFRGLEFTASVSPMEINPQGMFGGEFSQRGCTITFAVPLPDFTDPPQQNERIGTTAHGDVEIFSFSKSPSSYVIIAREIARKRSR